MTKFETTGDLWACVDCGFYLANGLPDDCEPTWKPENVGRAWGSEWHFCNGDKDDNEFSAYPCDLCGSKLAGTRMHVIGLCEVA